MIGFNYFTEAIYLPEEWDNLAENYFQHKAFLIHTENHNPCHQRYFTVIENGRIVAGAVVYSLRLDLLTYLKIKSPVKMKIVGIPCSVSSAGVFGDMGAVDLLKEHIYKKEKGFVLMLNLKDKTLNNNGASGSTLPTIVLHNKFRSWEHYLGSLKSDYRRRLKKITEGITETNFIKSSCADFTPEMYRQYLEVLKRSKGKLESLSFSFFKNLPVDFILTQYRKYDKLLGWNIAVESNKTYYFFLGGVDYKRNKKNNTYLSLLARIVKDGIELGVEKIDLGQTAEIPKMRLGGRATELFMEARHSNNTFNFLLKRFGKSMEYKFVSENPHPFKTKRQ